MIRNKKCFLGISIAFVTFLLVASAVLTQAAGGYNLSWWTIQNGGSASGGGYNLQGVIGQIDASSARGGEYTLNGGFLSRFSIFDFLVFVPLILR